MKDHESEPQQNQPPGCAQSVWTKARQQAKTPGTAFGEDHRGKVRLFGPIQRQCMNNVKFPKVDLQKDRVMRTQHAR